MCSHPYHPGPISRPEGEPYQKELAVGQIMDNGEWASSLINMRMCCLEAVGEVEARTKDYQYPTVRHPDMEAERSVA